MNAWILVSAACFAGFVVVAVWPWVEPWLERRDVPNRLLDRLEEEWDREGDAPDMGWRGW